MAFHGKRRLAALTLSVGLLLAGCAGPGGETEPSASAAESGGVTAAGFKTGARWQPDEFVISTLVGLPYGATETQTKRAVRYHKEAGFNTIEMVNVSAEDMDMALRACGESGIKVLVGDPDLMPGSQKSDAEILSKMQSYAAYEETIRGFFICDEPAHDPALYREIAAWSDRLRQLAPTKLMFSNLFPSYGKYTWGNTQNGYRNTAYARYADEFFAATDPDVLSVDYYVFAFSTACEADLDRNSLWRDWGYFRRRSIETGKPFWCYIQSLGEFAAAKRIGNMTGERIAVQVNAAVAYGAKGISYYNSLCTLIDERAYKTELYEAIQAVNRGVATYGNILLDKTYDELYHTAVPEALNEPYFADDLKNSRRFVSLPDGALVSTFTGDAGEVYMMVVNRSYTRELSGTAVLKTAADVAVISPETGAETPVGSRTDTLDVSLTKGGAALYVLRPCT